VKDWFACLNFNLSAGDTLPPVDADTCVDTLPELSCGLVLFDMLIANNDRHAKNFSVDFLQTPPRMSVFDHSHALFGHASGQGLARLTALRDRLAISGGPVTSGNRHCLLDKIKTDDHFDHWYARIQSIPDHLIKDALLRYRTAGHDHGSRGRRGDGFSDPPPRHHPRPGAAEQIRV
jgi:hypothetical protein